VKPEPPAIPLENDFVVVIGTGNARDFIRVLRHNVIPAKIRKFPESSTSRMFEDDVKIQTGNLHWRPDPPAAWAMHRKYRTPVFFRAVRQARLTLCIGLPGERGLGNTNGLSEGCSFFHSLSTSQANRLNGKGCVSVFADPVQIELVRTPTAPLWTFQPRKSSSRLPTAAYSPLTIHCVSLAARQWSK
jgi:hypothetical protein